MYFFLIEDVGQNLNAEDCKWKSSKFYMEFEDVVWLLRLSGKLDVTSRDYAEYEE